MRIGIPAEVKNNETRVAATPSGVHAFVAAGHEVVVQSGAGLGSSFPDDEYVDAGASIGTVDDAWGAPLVLKVKEPDRVRVRYACGHDLTLFTYLHLAANEPLTRALVESGTTAIAYETVQLADGSLPLLAPMSEVAGRMAALVGSYHLMSSQGGRGVLVSGVPGVRPAKVAVLGAGVAGWGAIGQAAGMGADVTVLDLSVPRLRHIDDVFRGRVKTVVSNPYEVERTVLEADLVIGAVLVPGARAPHLVSHDLVSRMKPGSVLGGHRDRSRRMLRGLAPHHPRRAHVPRRGFGVLLRGQHARCRGQHLDHRADQRHHALRLGDREQGLGCGIGRRRGSRQGAGRLRRTHPQRAHGGSLPEPARRLASCAVVRAASTPVRRAAGHSRPPTRNPPALRGTHAPTALKPSPPAPRCAVIFNAMARHHSGRPCTSL